MSTKVTSRIADGMHVIVYPNSSADVRTDNDQRVAYAERSAALAESLGLTQIAQRRKLSKHSHVGLAWCADNDVPHLNEEDYRTWCNYLRGSYLMHGDAALGLRNESRSWKEYDHIEDVPGPVLELMNRVKDLFTDLEIRAPEPDIVDPALFGHIIAGGRHIVVLLARWGRDSSIDVIESAYDVQLILNERWRVEMTRWQMGTDPILLGLGYIMLALFGSLVGSTIAYYIGFNPEPLQIGSIGLIGAPILPLILWYKMRQARLKRHEANTAFASQYPHLVPLL